MSEGPTSYWAMEPDHKILSPPKNGLQGLNPILPAEIAQDTGRILLPGVRSRRGVPMRGSPSGEELGPLLRASRQTLPPNRAPSPRPQARLAHAANTKELTTT